tara:strand:- start:862 stop:1092 length:231 start_codon:yes stop_codon:yes gene_type:complete
MQKPYQWLAWTSTAVVLFAACLSSFIPELYIHHYFFLIGNSLWAIVGHLWKEKSLFTFSILLNIVYGVGLVVNGVT